MVSSSNEDATSLIADITLTEKSGRSDTDEAIPTNDDSTHPGNAEDGFVPVEFVTGSTENLIVSTTLSKEGNFLDEDSKSELCLQNDKKSVSYEVSDGEKGHSMRKRKYRVDILRCESLAALSPATLDRLFLRDYDIVVSMVPLPHSSVLPGPNGPIHFGPPCHSSMTPWMKLVLYSAVASGPLSVVLMKGQCLRLLPAPLAGCEKALIWSWDGSTIGGLGGKFEGNLVKGSILLHCLNSLLKYSAVLVQPLSRYDLDGSGKTITMDIPLPLKNSDGSIACIGEELGLCTEEISKLSSLLTDLGSKIDLWTMGYIRVLKLFKERKLDQFSPDDEKYEWVPLSVEFGVQPQDFFITESNQKDSSRQLMNYASGRWNPLVDPSSPISGALSEHQRLKLANRQRCRTEVLSFDGNILRSYALAPVYEAATRPIEESLPVSTGKVESDDADNKEVILPGLNLLFDGSELYPFDIGACLQARQPVSLIAEASAVSASSAIK
ncbi:hypothetical protein Acr_04g0006070 [Actinidia rufa]|uniref:FAM91 C-terminal domain-containing protein n=1 Tax=Actinidia rufa TaxID=165716 RepID=A0A7J0EIX3_9ERIC|nr:hypothetical protein Acr_04g0006070 [Actinidia rufa]